MKEKLIALLNKGMWAYNEKLIDELLLLIEQEVEERIKPTPLKQVELENEGGC